MALKTLSMSRTVLFMKPWRLLPQKTIHSLSSSTYRGTQLSNYCTHDHSNNTNHDPSSSNVESDQTPQDAFRKLISEFQMTQGRVGPTANEIKRGKVTYDDPVNEWLRLDKRVNTYPSVRRFTAIGLGGEDFVNAMIVAAETVLERPIPQGQVNLKVSSGGKYVSVNLGPLKVVSGEQVQAVYNAMRRDARVKCFL